LIIKELTIPMRVLIDQALLQRLTLAHNQKNVVESDLAKQLAGYRGEKNLRYHLIFLPEGEYKIFYDLQLCVNNTMFQIDCLLLSNYFSLIIEVKNISGTLIFDYQSEQCIRIKNGKEDGFPNPILQAARHQLLLQKWLKQYKIHSLPIEYFVVIAYPSTIIKPTTNDKTLYDKVLHAEKAIHKIEKFQKLHKQESINSLQLKKICKTLLISHTPTEINIFDRFEISEKEIIKGVKCPSCTTSIMKRKHGTWFCARCQFYSKKAHEQALLEYFLLFGPNITNKQFREFTLLPDRKTAAYLLSTMQLTFTHKGNKNIYHPPSNDWIQSKYPLKDL
jgi:ribosomal protein L37AE/L43A